MNPERYKHQRYLMMTLDPLHPGAGGYRLGRVDNSIAREPGTRLPKIPGSSLHGAVRAYASYLYEKPKCAGQGQQGSSKHCGHPGCPICYTFGYIKDKEMSSGVVNVFDAQALLFPVHSLAGPVWVSTPGRMREAGFIIEPEGSPPDTDCWTTLLQDGRINLGWLMLAVAGKTQVRPPKEWNVSEWQTVAKRIVLVADALFSHIVNSNLEVRTSVAINPETGAAEEGALFTYEALPRATLLTAEAVLDDFRINNPQPAFPVQKTVQGADLPGGEWKDPLDVVTAGLKMIEYLSIGGMGTRGFGRLKPIGQPLVKSQEQIFGALLTEAQL